MTNKELLFDFPFSEYIDYIKGIVSMYEMGNEDKYMDIHRELDAVENKINDEDLYLGVVGSFSSGKSTFINSVIQKNLLPTDAVQGTTVAASILKKADFEDLEIQYSDDSIKRYSESSAELNNRYGITLAGQENQERQEHKISLLRRIINWIKRLFHLNAFERKENEIIFCNNRTELFKKVIATEELASDIKRVTLYYQNENIPYRIALVDTPGTESLNERHGKIAKSAIDEICDAIVVIIPYDEPVSEDLVNYVNSNLEKNKSECIFIVTKIELLNDKDELPRLMRVIKKRLENGLSIESAQVVPMPTLIYLKNADPEMEMTLPEDIENMSESDKNELIEMYEKGIAQIKGILEEKRNSYIRGKIVDICERVSKKLNSNLSEVVSDYDEKIRILSEASVPPLNFFEDKAARTIMDYLQSNKKRVSGEVSLMTTGFSDLREYIDNVVSGCSNSQELTNRMNFTCADTLSDIQERVINYLSSMSDGYNQEVRKLGTEFVTCYEACGVDANAFPTSINVQNFFPADFINECDGVLQDRIEGIKTSIYNDTSGFFKKVKSFFSNPVGKHKDMALSGLYEVVDQISQEMTLCIQHGIESSMEKAAYDGENSIKNLIEKNRKIIEGYITRTNQSMMDNSRGKEETQKHIDRLNQYIKTIKEAG